MTEDKLKKEFELRKLKNEVTKLNSENVKLNMKLKSANKKINARIIKESKNIENKYKKEVIKLERQVQIKEDLEQRLAKKLDEKNEEIEALKNKILELTEKLNLTEQERDKYLARLNIDGTTSGTPTSQTPINKNKVIPNTREKSTRNKGGQLGHTKHKLKAFSEEEINEKEEITLCECPKCSSKELKEIDSSVTKDELDYEIRIIKKRYYFKEYECENCKNIVRQNIPKKLKEENQYGAKVQAHALSLVNVGNVSVNKVRRIISGITLNEINLSEGYICKLQKRASNLLEEFNNELRKYILSLDLVHWDDTVIFVNGKRACLRTYCNNNVVLYKAHLQKNKAGIDEDKILSNLPSTTKVVHDHNKVNYNEEYIFVNVECCVHLERDLKKVKLNIVESTWSEKLEELFSSYNTKRKQYIEENKERFSIEETNKFMIEFDKCILLGVEENEKHQKSHYYQTERALLERLMEYRDNYTYWLYDFTIPYTNNEAERSLRGVKTKMKVSGQFANIENAKYYANIKSYIETCHKNNINETEAIIRLFEGNPYTVNEIIEIGQLKNNE